MILTVTLNAALDVTYTVDELVTHGSHRVRSVHERAGGKGVNVASVLTTLGVPVTATGVLGGSSGTDILHDLDQRGIDHDFVLCHGSSRRTVNVVSARTGDATIFNEPGPDVDEAEWDAVRRRIPELLDALDVDVLVLSGSLPPGVPEDAYAQLVRAARTRDVATVVDADGVTLERAVPAHPDVVKPNTAELRRATQRLGSHGPETLQRLGALDVVISAGADGLTALTRDGQTYRAGLPISLRGNPTGAGDAVVAALAAGLQSQQSWPDRLAYAVAWSAAAVLGPRAGELDRADVERLLPQVVVRTDPLTPDC